MGLPHPFFRGPGGPSHVRQRRVSEAEIVAHLLRLHHRRFSQEASFIFFVHSVIQKRTVTGIKSSLEESKELATLMKAVVDSVGQADLTRAENAAALDRCTDSMTQQMTTVQGSQGSWRSKSTEVQAMVRSPVLRQPTLFMTLSAADWLWLDFLKQALPSTTLPNVAAPSKTQCSEALASNPNLAVEHFNSRPTTPWDDIIMGEGRLLGTVKDYFWLIELHEQGSPHNDMLL